MADFKERSKQRMFVKKLEAVSADLANWAQEKFNADWSLADVKLHLTNAMKVVERD